MIERKLRRRIFRLVRATPPIYRPPRPSPIANWRRRRPPVAAVFPRGGRCRPASVDGRMRASRTAFGDDTDPIQTGSINASGHRRRRSVGLGNVRQTVAATDPAERGRRPRLAKSADRILRNARRREGRAAAPAASAAPSRRRSTISAASGAIAARPAGRRAATGNLPASSPTTARCFRLAVAADQSRAMISRPETCQARPSGPACGGGYSATGDRGTGPGCAAVPASKRQPADPRHRRRAPCRRSR